MSIECSICERDARAVVKSLKRTDIKLLQDALKSNGGGINPEYYSFASRDRLFEAGLIQWKPNHYSAKTGYTSLITITKAGENKLMAINGGERMSKFTPWFSGYQKPVRVGVYQRKHSELTSYCFWNGYTFSFGYLSAESAHAYRSGIAQSQNLPWRGLTKESK